MGLTSFNRRRREAASPEGTDEVLTGGDGSQVNGAHVTDEQALADYRAEVDRIETTIEQAQARLEAVLSPVDAEGNPTQVDEAELSLEAVEEVAAARRQLEDAEAEQDALVKPEPSTGAPATDERPDNSDGVKVWRLYAHAIGKGSEEDLAKLDKRAIVKLIDAPAA